jgi:hypothetical protein
VSTNPLVDTSVPLLAMPQSSRQATISGRRSSPSAYEESRNDGQPVEQRRGHLGVGEDARPFGKGEIGRSSRTIWRIGLCSTKNARLIRPIVSTVSIPGHAPQAQPGGAFDDSGMGRYSTLFTPKAGALFQVAFQVSPGGQSRPARPACLTTRRMGNPRAGPE